MQYSFLSFTQTICHETSYLYLTCRLEKQEIEGYFSTTGGKDSTDTYYCCLAQGEFNTKNFFSAFFLHQVQATFSTILPYLSDWSILFSESHPATINTHFHASQKAVSQPSALNGDDDLKLHHWLRRQVSFSPFPFV